MSEPSFREFFRKAEQSLNYWVEGALIDFTEELCRVMEERGVTRAELARRLGTSPAYVTKILRGHSNFTLASMVRVAKAIDHELHIHLAPRNSMTHWLDDIAPVAVSGVTAVSVPATASGAPTASLIVAA